MACASVGYCRCVIKNGWLVGWLVGWCHQCTTDRHDGGKDTTQLQEHATHDETKTGALAPPQERQHRNGLTAQLGAFRLFIDDNHHANNAHEWPVRFTQHNFETTVLDQVLCDLRSQGIEFLRHATPCACMMCTMDLGQEKAHRICFTNNEAWHGT